MCHEFHQNGIPATASLAEMSHPHYQSPCIFVDPIPTPKACSFFHSSFPKFVGLSFSKSQTSSIARPSIQSKDFSPPQLLFTEVLWNTSSNLSKCRTHDFTEITLIFCIQSNDASFVSTYYRFTGLDDAGRCFYLLWKSVFVTSGEKKGKQNLLVACRQSTKVESFPVRDTRQRRKA